MKKKSPIDTIKHQINRLTKYGQLKNEAHAQEHELRELFAELVEYLIPLAERARELGAESPLASLNEENDTILLNRQPAERNSETGEMDISKTKTKILNTSDENQTSLHIHELKTGIDSEESAYSYIGMHSKNGNYRTSKKTPAGMDARLLPPGYQRSVSINSYLDLAEVTEKYSRYLDPAYPDDDVYTMDTKRTEVSKTEALAQIIAFNKEIIEKIQDVGRAYGMDRDRQAHAKISGGKVI